MNTFNDEIVNVVDYVKKIEQIKEIILTNVMLVGQADHNVNNEDYSTRNGILTRRMQVFTERMADLSNVKECSIDNYGNCIGVIKGNAIGKPPIVLVAHMDTVFTEKQDVHYLIKDDRVVGGGIVDNILGVATLLSLPTIFEHLKLSFDSDIILIGLFESLGPSNLASIRNLLSTWQSPIRAAICIEGAELGRLNYFSKSMIRADIKCKLSKYNEVDNDRNAIIVINEIINDILKIRIPQRPKTEIIFGQISAGDKYGHFAYESELEFEIQSDSDKLVNSIYNKIEDIVSGAAHKMRIKIDINKVSNIGAANIDYSHPLVKNTVEVMSALDIEPVIESSESELSIFLDKKIPAITVGISYGEDYFKDFASINIESMYKGISQVIGVLRQIDLGVCDE